MRGSLTLSANRIRANGMVTDSIIMVGAGLATGLFLYLYQISMGMLLPPDEYGILVSLVSIFAIFLIFTQAVTLAVARTISTRSVGGGLPAANYIWHLSLKRMVLLGILIFCFLAAMTPIFADFLGIDNHVYCLTVFGSLIFAFPLSTNLGVMQGLQRFPQFGISRGLLGFSRLAIGVVLVSVGFGLEGGLIALPLSFLVMVVFTTFLLRDLSQNGNEPVQTDGFRSYLGFTVIAMLAIAGLANLDVVFAKHYLSSTEAGNYSAIAVLGRIAFYAPAGIALAIFPKVSKLYHTGGNHHQLFFGALLVTLTMVGGLCLIYALFPDSIASLLFSDEYSSISKHMFSYGVAMSLLAIANLAATYFLALGSTKISYIVLGVMFLQIGLMYQFHANISQFINVMIACNGLLVAFMIVFWSRIKYREDSKLMRSNGGANDSNLQSLV